MSNLYREPSKDASYQISVHLAKRLQRRRFFRNQPIIKKNCLWWPCLLTEQDEMSNLYRGHAIDASYQVSVHFAKRFQRRFLTRGSVGWACIAHLTIEWYWSKFQREIIITLKNSSHLEWRVGLSDTILKGTHPGTIYARFEPYIDASCQVWLHLAKLFQRRRFF